MIGEVKYSRTENPSSAVKELYEAARQAVFYLGVYGKDYDDALIVIADSSKQQAFVEGLGMVNAEIVSRFGQETRVHLATIPLR